jgi:hypothetical protein
VAAQQFGPAIDVLTKLTSQPEYKKPDGFVALGAAYVQAKRYKEAVARAREGDDAGARQRRRVGQPGLGVLRLKDAAKFKETAGKARTLGYKEPNLLDYLKKIEGGMTIK